MQPLDFTTLTAVCQELRQAWLPARLEQVFQRDRFTLYLALRTLQGRCWLLISWHPQAARLHISEAPPKQPDTFTFSQQIWHQFSGLALVDLCLLSPWERVVDLQFARRPGDESLGHLYVEIMGQYSNVILVNSQQEIISAAHQVSRQQSSLRPIQTGDRYEAPPSQTQISPSLEESFQRWHDRLTLVPDRLRKALLSTYRGLSSALVTEWLQAAGLDWEIRTEAIALPQWQVLFQQWQTWLQQLADGTFQPSFTGQGYLVLGKASPPQLSDRLEPTLTVQQLLDRYYGDHLNQQEFAQLRHQLQQRVQACLTKLRTKRDGFLERLTASDRADLYRQQADLLMAHLQDWQVGMNSIQLTDFETGQLLTIPLSPEKNAVQNAQGLYKQHQKLKRAKDAIAPLLQAVQSEITYLEQVATALQQIDHYQTQADLGAIGEIREELIQQGYCSDPFSSAKPRKGVLPSSPASQPIRFQTPSGFELLIGRNNRQNDHLTFRTASDYDLWFHTQEIPGSHSLLRIPAGSVADEADLQFTADLTAYYSQARQSEQVPVIYTQPKWVFKPKGSPPGTVIYRQETVIWGNPQRAQIQ
ncbi:MAG: NFACT RNA binding domain-containing protein [Synechococcales bacterium]|nr:NFACT RNA binding domain-containing protein [Synechococcales bacterium]